MKIYFLKIAIFRSIINEQYHEIFIVVVVIVVPPHVVNDYANTMPS